MGRGMVSRRGALGTMAGASALGLGLRGCVRWPPPGTVEFWTLALSPFEPFLRERFDAFERARPGARVKWVDVPFEAVDRKLIAAAAAGRAPDLINLSDRTFGRFVGLGAMADLSADLPGDPADVYLPGALSIGRIGRGLLALPWYLTTQVGLVNRGLLERSGIAPDGLAQDWRSLWAQAAAAHAKLPAGAYLFSQPLGEESQIPIMLLAEGLPPLRDEGGRLRADLARPEIEEFIAGWARLYRAGGLPPEAATRDHSHLTEMFQEGRLALIDTGPNFLRRVRDAAPAVYTRTSIRPPVTGALGRAHIATMVLGVTTQAREPRLAAELAWHMTSAESQAALARLAPVLPSARAALDDPLFAAPDEATLSGPDGLIAHGRAISAASLREAVAFTPALAVWPDLRRSLEAGMKRLLLGSGPVAEELRRVNREWDTILAAAAPDGGTIDAVPRPAPVRRASARGGAA